MDRHPTDGVKFFSGIEVEHTPAHGLGTLFVVGVQPVDEIARQLNGARHIYFGANMSFPKLSINDSQGWSPWESMVKHFLDLDYLCTLDIPVDCAEGLLESGLTEHDNFIPMISVKLPYIQQLGYNATIKLDDKGFRATNPGVWCHSVHALQDRKVFTPWHHYEEDREI
jgi:hypothetical protein